VVLRKARPLASSPLPGYADLQEIGGGAFATVYKAVEVETGRPVALKILKVDTIHAQLLETFTHEIQALAAVSDHPNIVTLYRPASTVDGRPVLVLELCRESFGQRLRTNGPMDPVEVTRTGIKIAGALETAHRNGFLHRDMKPQNILMTQFGEPALADFGVAALQASAQLTAGVFGFTTLHAAPEMLEGQHLSPATDIYGLASTMYQLLTGRAPFASYDNEAPASVILRILRDPVRPLRAENIPLDLADLLEGALSKEPDGRPRSALEFALLLQRIEVAQGWTETTFVAWGQEGRQPTPPAPVRGPLGVSGADVGGGQAWSLAAAGAGSGTAGPRTGFTDPLLSSPGIVTPAVGHRGATERPETVHEADRAGGHGPSSLPPLLPPAPPAAPVRPSLADPGPGARSPVAPLDAVQGRDAPPPPPPPPRPAQSTRPVYEAAPRPEPPDPPVFVDPDPSERPDTTSVYEQTMGVHQLIDRPTPPSPASAPADSAAARRLAGFPWWAIGGLALAVVVVVLAVLLLTGVV
jgi:Protein kinase domain